MDINQRLRARIDKQMLSLLGLQTNVEQAPQEPLTLDTLRKMMLALPKPDLFLSTKLFSGENALIVEGGKAKYTVAHPGFWLKLEYHVRQVAPTLTSPNPLIAGTLPLFGIRIEEIDPHETDDEARRAHLEQLWADLKEAVLTAMVELPEWLRSSPKFGTHG